MLLVNVYDRKTNNWQKTAVVRLENSKTGESMDFEDYIKATTIDPVHETVCKMFGTVETHGTFAREDLYREFEQPEFDNYPSRIIYVHVHDDPHDFLYTT